MVAVHFRADALEVERFAAKLLVALPPGERIRSEALAEGLREEYGLGPFPKLPELHALLTKLKIEQRPLPKGSGLSGLNIWGETGSPLVLVDQASRIQYQETTITHELREVLENAFSRVSPGYPALTTHENARMNPTSERFGGYLLMETQASVRVFERVGFDPLTFARQVGRSLPSVIVRMQTLFPAACATPAPRGAYRLFSASDPQATAADLTVRQAVSLNGFIVARQSILGNAARVLIPEKGTPASAHPDVLHAVATQLPSITQLPAVDLFGELSHLQVIEPIARNGDVKAVVFALVHTGSKPLVETWLNRLGPS